MAAPPPPRPPASSSYVDMLVEGQDGGGLTALETIREAGNVARARDDDDGGHHAPRSTSPAEEAEEGSAVAPTQRPQRHSCKEVAFRTSTPDRIRRRSEMLHGDVQAMITRHDSRTGREREVLRRESRGSRVAVAEVTHRDSLRRSSSNNASANATSSSGRASRELTVASPAPLPDLHQMFEESRRAYLTEAQQQRTYFPSSSKPTAYSSKDPGTFSYRFQSSDAGPTGGHAP